MIGVCESVPKREITFKSAGIQTGDPSLLKTVDPTPFGIKTPIDLGTGRSGIFQMHFNPISQIDDNLRNLILTNNGERLGNYAYGANLRPLTTELSALDDFDSIAMDRISAAVKKFMPFVELSTFSSDAAKIASSAIKEGTIQSMATISLSIKYSIPRIRVGERSLDILIYCIG